MVIDGISEHNAYKPMLVKAYRLSRLGVAPIERIFVGKSRQNEPYFDTFYIICGRSAPFSTRTEEQSSVSEDKYYTKHSFICHFKPHRIDALDNTGPPCSLRTMPHTGLTACGDYSITSLYSNSSLYSSTPPTLALISTIIHLLTLCSTTLKKNPGSAVRSCRSAVILIHMPYPCIRLPYASPGTQPTPLSPLQQQRAKPTFPFLPSVPVYLSTLDRDVPVHPQLSKSLLASHPSQGEG